ncbi:MAG: MFS transporter [Planctomycetota bacterium]
MPRLAPVLARLNPLRGLPNPREVWAWGTFDLANQSFTLLIITLLFPLYFKQVVVGEPVVAEALGAASVDPSEAAALAAAFGDRGEGHLTTEEGSEHLAALEQVDPSAAAAVRDAFETAANTGDFRWGLVVSCSLLLVVIVSPVLGALADAKAWRKQILLTVGVVCGVMTMGLGLIGPGALLGAVALFVVGNIGYQLSENFLASFLPSISTRKNIGRVSAIGWSMGYLGALCLLVILAISTAVLGWETPPQWKPFFVFAGLWFLVGMLPTAFLLPDDTVPDPDAHTNLFVCAYHRLADTVSHASRYRQLVLFLSAFLIYGFGVQVIVNFASILAKDLGIEGTGLVIFVMQITVTAGLAAFATSRFQDTIGTKPTLLIYLGLWLVSALAVLGIELASDPPQWTFWLAGNGLGFALGGSGTATRAMVGQFTPRHRAAEFFGLWGLTNKLAGAIGVPVFATVKSAIGDAAALGVLSGFFLVGGVMVLFVSERGGALAARRAEREWAATLHQVRASNQGSLHDGRR